MIKTADFKKQVAGHFGQEMRNLGFKGSGFDYFQESDDFLFAVYISPSRWSGSCTAGLAIHPKQVTKDSEGALNLNKLKIYDYEFKMSLWEYASGEWWKFSEEEDLNIRTVNEILDLIKVKALPAINQFQAEPNILDTYQVADLENFYDTWTKKTGLFISTSEVRFAWAITLYLEHKNPMKAKEFAVYGLSQLPKRDKWFGKADFQRVLNEDKSA